MDRCKHGTDARNPCSVCELETDLQVSEPTPRVVPIANPFGETFSERAVHAVRDSELQIGVLITKCRVGAFSMDIFVADAVEEDASEWDALAVTLDNLADFARREAFKRKK